MTSMLRRVTQSRTNYAMGFLIEVFCPCVFAYLGWQHAPPWGRAAISVVAGAFAFSFVEYAIHRWLFHSSASVMSPLHHAHHASPRDSAALPCISSAVVSLALWPFAVRAAGPGIAGFVLCGFFGWYAVYSALHHLEHHIPINRLPSRWLQRRWATHTLHHRRADTNFGVTTSVWDRVFGTHYQSRKQRGGSQASTSTSLAASNASPQ